MGHSSWPKLARQCSNQIRNSANFFAVLVFVVREIAYCVKSLSRLVGQSYGAIANRLVIVLRLATYQVYFVEAHNQIMLPKTKLKQN